MSNTTFYGDSITPSDDLVQLNDFDAVVSDNPAPFNNLPDELIELGTPLDPVTGPVSSEKDELPDLRSSIDVESTDSDEVDPADEPTDPTEVVDPADDPTDDPTEEPDGE